MALDLNYGLDFHAEDYLSKNIKREKKEKKIENMEKEWFLSRCFPNFPSIPNVSFTALFVKEFHSCFYAELQRLCKLVSEHRLLVYLIGGRQIENLSDNYLEWRIRLNYGIDRILVERASGWSEEENTPSFRL